MRNYLKCSLLICGLFISSEVFADTVQGPVEKVSVEHAELPVGKVFDAPNYDRLLPIIGWNRRYGDSAGTIGEWKRWWIYLRMKNPVVMRWMHGLLLKVHPGNEIFRALFVKGVYDPNMIVAINSLLPQNGVFIDVGANMGYCSLPISKSVGELGKVFAIEPSQRDYLRLLENIKINKLGNVKAFRLAISDKTEKVDIMIASEERSALNTLEPEFSDKGVEKLGSETVQAVALDEFVEKEQINKIDVIKLDVEGSEVPALVGARNSIEKYRPALILGINDEMLKLGGFALADLEQFLKSVRYKLYELEEFPLFAFREISGLHQTKSKIVFCMHETMVPPFLPQAVNKSWSESLKEFFTR